MLSNVKGHATFEHLIVILMFDDFCCCAFFYRTIKWPNNILFRQSTYYKTCDIQNAIPTSNGFEIKISRIPFDCNKIRMRSYYTSLIFSTKILLNLMRTTPGDVVLPSLADVVNYDMGAGGGQWAHRELTFACRLRLTLNPKP